MDSHPFTLLLGAVLLLLALVFSAEALGAADRLTIARALRRPQIRLLAPRLRLAVFATLCPLAWGGAWAVVAADLPFGG